jgi:RNA recognition motif-containing protein
MPDGRHLVFSFSELTMNIYVGNLSYGATDESLTALFSQYGTVDRASIITDRETGRSRGFGFVEMPNESEGDAAIEALNDKEVDGRSLKVNKARPKTEQRPRSGGGYGGGGRDRGGYGGGRDRGGYR